MTRPIDLMANTNDYQTVALAIVPLDWGPVGAVDVGHTMDEWPGRQPADAGWVYVSVGGDVHSEAVTVIVADDGGALDVRHADFGRP